MITVIIPTYNEQEHIAKTIRSLWLHDEASLISEIIIADGGSKDKTLEVAQSEGVRAVVSPRKGRAAQMNYGASVATQNILYFIHADTVPPLKFTNDINTALIAGYDAGCYRLAFDYNHWFLKANCWFTKFNVNAVRFGDQSLFVKKEKFQKLHGFCEKHIVLEDQHIIRRLKKVGKFTIIQKPVTTSARKYVENGIYKTQALFFLIYFMYRLGYSQERLVTTYRNLIKQDKL